MNERALITTCVLLSVLVACGLIAMFAPHMRRIFWILGLSLALLEFGGITIGGLFWVIRHRHLTFNGSLGVIANGYMSLMIAQYLRNKIRERS